MREKKFKIMILLASIILVNISSFIKINTVDAATITNIVLFNGDSWSVSVSTGDYIGTINGNKKGDEYKKDYATAKISKNTLKITGTAIGTNYFYIYNSKGKLSKEIHATIKSTPVIKSITNTYQNSGTVKSSNVYLYEGQSSTVTLNYTGAKDKIAWTCNNSAAVTISSSTAVSTSIKGVSAGTYTLTATLSTASNGTKGTVKLTKSITVYVYKKPAIDVMANGTSVSSFSMTKANKIKITQRMSNLGSGVKCTISAKVNDNSMNYITLTNNAANGYYELSAKDGFTAGNTAYFTYTLSITSGDNVSNNNGTQIITRTITITYGNFSPNTYISLKNNSGTVLGNNQCIYSTLPFYPEDAGATSFSFTSSNSNIVTVKTYSQANNKCTYAFYIGSGRGVANVTVTSKLANGTTHSKVYTIRVIDAVLKLKCSSFDLMTNSSSKALVIEGLTSANYFQNTYTNVALNPALLSYSSSNGNVLTIDTSGNVKPVKSGTATITVNYNWKYSVSLKNPVTNKSETISVNGIVAKSVVNVYAPITKLEFIKKSISVNRGKSVYNAFKIYPENEKVKNKFSWLSSNESVATVDKKGNVKANAPGRATITVMAQDGSKKVASYVVNVVAKAPRGVKASCLKSGIRVNWSSVVGTSTYDVYRSTSTVGSFIRVGTTKGLSYVDKSAVYGITYYYKIAAVPNAGVNYTSSLSTSVKIKYIPGTPKIKSIKKSSGGYRIKIKGTKYDGYMIYMGTKKKPKHLVCTVQGKSATVFLKKGKKYYIYVRAYVNKNNKIVYSKYSKVKKYKAK